MPLLDCDRADCEWWGRCKCMLQVMVKQQQTKAKQVIQHYSVYDLLGKQKADKIRVIDGDHRLSIVHKTMQYLTYTAAIVTDKYPWLIHIEIFVYIQV